jgi:energy-coupling factor transporter ATP-binding protein EcfA2
MIILLYNIILNKMPSKSSSKSKPTSNRVDGIQDYYGIMPASFKTKYHNPCYSDHGINIPARILVIGSSGSGKSTLALEIIRRMQDTFSLIVLCVKCADEPLYNYLRSKIKPESIQVFENGVIPPIREYADYDGQILFIFDDLVNERRQEPIIEYYIRGRKAAKGITMMYLSQTYYGIPKTIRLQANYVFVKKIQSIKDLNMMMRDYSLNLSKEELLQLYQYCTDAISNFMFIDLETTPEKRFRKNFQQVFDIPIEGG